MIQQEHVMPLILRACPSFRETWDKSEDRELLYVVMGDLARHLLTLYRAKQTAEFAPLCEVIERLHLEGDGFVRELATVGILEAIQNVWGHTDTASEEFCEFLLPESRRWWNELNDLWAGKIPYLGAGLRNQ